MHVDELAEVAQRGPHIRIHLVKRSPLHGILEEVASKGRMSGEARVASKGGLIITGVEIGD
jgi:hypothetical protein